MIISIIMDAVIGETFRNIYNVTVGLDKINLKNIIISCLGLQAGWGVENPMINNPMWYISVLLLCYIVFYIITKISKKIKISPFWLYGIDSYSRMHIILVFGKTNTKWHRSTEDKGEKS